MFDIGKVIVSPLIVAFLIVFGLTPVVIKLAKKLKIIDDPRKSNHPKVIHSYPVPRGGGLSLFVGVAITSLIFLPLDKHLIGILAGAILIACMGFLDDRFNLNPYLRLLLGLIAA